MNSLKKTIGEKISFFLTNLFHASWLFFPGILFLILIYCCFGVLSQGQDLMVLSSEHSGNFGLFLFALCFFAIIGWFGARKVADIKHKKNAVYLTQFLYKHAPRFIGFSFFTLLIIAYAKTPLFNHRQNPTTAQTIFYWVILIASFGWYWLCTRFMEKRFKRIEFNWLFFLFVTAFISLTSILCFNLNNSTHPFIFVILLLSQSAFLAVVITRRKVIETKEEHSLAEKVIRIIFYLLIFFIAIIYLSSTIWVGFAVYITSFPFALLAFSVFMSVGFMLSFWSIKKGFNIHIVILFFVFLFGLWTERHFVNLKENTNVNFKNRASLEQYFTKWADTRKNEIDSTDSYPVYFVLSDGGASRSGYWVASVLSRLQDNSNGKFGKHLFCLSGASGGSAGNAAFYMLLRKMKNENTSAADSLYLQRSRDYLQSDFLTYTLSRMLGHDFFIQLSPFDSEADRAKALTESLESSPHDSVFLKNALAIPFSQLMIDAGNPNDSFPIICINTTRMQDGNPSVISTINIAKNDKQFNRRIDVLDILQPGKDMKLSTAVVLGASFPYISPAGRIDARDRTNKKDTILENYFVDGGYVDNSGAGVVHEMIIQLNKIISNTTDPVLKNRLGKLRLTVIHITNGVEGDILAKKVNPFINDLAAPLKTMVGAFSIQTSVNDSRLKNYMESFGNGNKNYWDINLYGDNDIQHYSMNWVISQHTLKRMDTRLRADTQLKQLLLAVNK